MLFQSLIFFSMPAKFVRIALNPHSGTPNNALSRCKGPIHWLWFFILILVNPLLCYFLLFHAIHPFKTNFKWWNFTQQPIQTSIHTYVYPKYIVINQWTFSTYTMCLWVKKVSISLLSLSMTGHLMDRTTHFVYNSIANDSQSPLIINLNTSL